jgi:hypothetical protein
MLMPSLPAAPAPPLPPAEHLFRELCLSDDQWLDDQFPDFDFWYLLKALQLRAGNGGVWLYPQSLWDLVNWHELHGDLWWYVLENVMPLYQWC